MSLFALISFFTAVNQVLSDTKPCRPELACLPVPADICDNSNCVPYDLQEHIKAIKQYIIETGLRIFTWNIQAASYNGPCPLKYKNEVSGVCDDNKTAMPATITIQSGRYCNITTSHVVEYLGEVEQYTGKTKFLTESAGDDKYEACMLHYDPGVAYVIRKCKVSPPSADGKSCAKVVVYEMASGNCKRDKLTAFLQELDVDFLQLLVNDDCTIQNS